MKEYEVFVILKISRNPSLPKRGLRVFTEKSEKPKIVYNQCMGHLLEIVKRRLNPGTLIFDMNNKLSYANEEAMEILPTLQSKTTRTKKLQIPNEIYKNINEEIKLGIFSDTSEAVVSALKKSYARKSRTFLRWLMKKERISETELLEEFYLRQNSSQKPLNNFFIFGRSESSPRLS